MGTKIKRIYKKISLKRTTVLILVFVIMSVVLVRRLFDLQIIQGEDYISKFQARTTKERVLKSTRGNILDTISYDSSRYYLYGLMKVEGIAG